MRDLVLEIRGGTLVGTYTDLPDVRVVLVDWDDQAAGDGAAGVVHHGTLSELPTETQAKYVSASHSGSCSAE